MSIYLCLPYGQYRKYDSDFLNIRKALSQYPTMRIECREIGGGFRATVAYTEQKNKFRKRSEKYWKMIFGLEREQLSVTIEKGSIVGPGRIVYKSVPPHLVIIGV